MNIPDRVLREINHYAKISQIQRVTLFGSRARGTNTERSDIDIAVSGGNFDEFYWNIKEEMPSLLSFDIVNLDSGISDELSKEIARDGVVLYEK